MERVWKIRGKDSATAIADAVWSAYENADQIHFYVPEEIGNTDKVKAHDIQAAKEEIREFLFQEQI